jgi:hypothetical protein
MSVPASLNVSSDIQIGSVRCAPQHPRDDHLKSFTLQIKRSWRFINTPVNSLKYVYSPTFVWIYWSWYTTIGTVGYVTSQGWLLAFFPPPFRDFALRKTDLAPLWTDG